MSQAYQDLLEELELPPSAPGGKVAFRRSLMLSFLFKFHLEVLHQLRETVHPQDTPLPIPLSFFPSLPGCSMYVVVTFDIV